MKMAVALERADDPMDYHIERVLPRLNNRLASYHADIKDEVRKVGRDMKEDMETMEKRVLENSVTQDEMKAAFDAAASHFKTGKQRQRSDASEGVSGGDESGDRAPIADLSSYKFQNPLRSIREAYYEYYGMENYKNRPVEGGVNALEVEHKSKWRKGWKGALQKHFSRVKLILTAVTKMTEDDHIEEVFTLEDS